MKKKILFFLYSLTGGGAERTVINIINNINKEKYDVVLVLGTQKNNDYIDLLPDNIRVKTLNCSKLRYCLFKLKKHIIEEKPDILFSTINANNIILLLAKFLTFKRISAIVREANNRTQSGSVTSINKLMTFLLYNYVANNIIALSKGVKDDLATNFKVNKEKIKVIYNPVEIEGIRKLSTEKIEDFYRKEDEKVVIAVGRLVEQKDFSTLIKAFNIVSKDVNAKLLILGKGQNERKLKKLVKDLSMEDKVIFMGFKKNPYKYMGESDIFVLSSKWEGFGHVIVEAMSIGVPVISTNCNSGPAEIIKDEYGVLVPVGNHQILALKIIELLKNNELRNNYSALGQRRAIDFNAKGIIKQYETVFSKLF